MSYSSTLHLDSPAERHPAPPRLAPIDRPRNPLVRLAYGMSRRLLGKVVTPMRVLYARVPALLGLSYHLARVETKKLSLDPELRFLLKSYVAALNGCSFCVDIAQAVARADGTAVDKYDALFDFRQSPRFTPRERAALAYVEEATQAHHVSDETFEALRTCFTEREIVEITWLNALENYYNLLNLPLGIASDDLCGVKRDATANAYIQHERSD